MFRDRRRNNLLSTAIGFTVWLWAWASPLEVAAVQARAAGGTTACRPPSSTAPDEALQLAVKLRTFVGTTFFQDGAGIIIGDRGGMLYVATAAHVVMDAGTPVDSIQAYFYTDCHKSVAARICSLVDPKRDLDLAVLCVPVAAAAGARPRSFARLGDVSRLSARTPVYPVGCPGGECWGVGQPDKVLVAGSNQPRILFTTFFVAPGHSGGPLFNEWWEVVGMLTKLGQPLSEAIPIDSVLSAACDTGCRGREETLERPFVPRGGYPLTLGLSGLFSSADGEPGDRFPPGRVNLMYRFHPLLELHGGGIRLTPENLSVTGAMIGLGLNLPSKGRVWLNPFLEGGFAHVEARVEIGAYYINQNGNNVRVPVWQQVKDDGLGYGAGVSLMALLVPHTIFELMVGHWDFNSPPGAPPLPDVVWGAGFRIGV
ncbi:MAG TPA: serine protease [Gemmatimonadales bacterium]|nr:serine protease [Gemmatimonadales bacterium]